MRLADLQIPARAEFVSVARLVVSSVVDDRYELTNDRLDNLKLAVSEACALAIEFHRDSDAAKITIACESNREGFDVLIHAAGNEFASARLAHEGLEVGGKTLEGEVGLPFIESLVDGMGLETVADDSVLRLTLLCEPAEEL
jgi:anti-sigma regulatory factor (Ser/Thr protein kinase)